MCTYLGLGLVLGEQSMNNKSPNWISQLRVVCVQRNCGHGVHC